MPTNAQYLYIAEHFVLYANQEVRKPKYDGRLSKKLER